MRIPIAEPSIGEEEIASVKAAVESGWVSSIGEYIPRFEDGFATYCGVKYGVATSNGTAALHLALAALGIGEKNEVLIPCLTFIATANTVTFTGATPVCVDSHPEYWCMDPERIESKITRRTKAIIPVHLYGHPCDMEPIIRIAQAHNLHIVEDAAEAHGAEYYGKRAGSFSHIACFSFFGNKIITTGEGGMCLTNDDELARRMKILRDHGTTPGKPYWHEVIGFNYRMTNLQAALGVAQLGKLDKFIAMKRQLAEWYKESLGELSSQGVVQLSPEMPWARSVYWMYSMLLDDRFGLSRDELIERLRERGIETRPFFYPVHSMPMYQSKEKFPVAEELSRKGINLPSSVNLTPEQVRYIAETIKELKS